MKRTWITLLGMGFVLSNLSLVGAQESLDLSGIKTYLEANVAQLQAETTRLETVAQEYYALAENAGFDYALVWANDRAAAASAVLNARDAWLVFSPLYEQVEGIVAGVPALADYDVVLDAGASGEDDPEEGVTFDLTLRDGRVLERPGNLFGVLESTLWGTEEAYSAGVAADLNLNSSLDFGDVLPDANVLLAAAETTRQYVDDLVASSTAWEPTTEDAFTALVVMVPTMSEYFASWRDSRFVSGEASTQRDFVVISRLADIGDILGGLQIVYDNVAPLIESADAAQNEQIATGLTNLQAYVNDIYTQELDGRIFTAEEADIFGTEAQTRAQNIAGQITQVAALLNITLPEE